MKPTRAGTKSGAFAGVRGGEMEAQTAERRLFRRRLLTLIFPIAFQQLMLAAVSASDAWMLGSLDHDSLSAVSLAGQITFVLNLFLAAMTIGTSMLAAQYWGKGDRTAVEKVFAGVLKVTAAVSLGFSLAALLIPELLMRVFTPDAVLIEKGAVYLRTVAVSYLLTGISQIYLCILKNSGRAVMSTVISSFAVVLNIGLNAVLIYGLFGAPRMEIAGAAAATVIARAAELLWCVIASGRRDRIRFRIHFALHGDRLLRRDFWHYTLPVLGNEIVWGCGFTMYSVIMGHLGSDAVAANSIATVVKNLIACFCTGLATGGGILVGNELGRGDLERAKDYGRRICRMAVAAGAVSGLLIVALTPLILHSVELSGQARGYLLWMLLMCSYYMVGKSVNMTAVAGIFCAGGDSRFGLKCDAVTMWGVCVPLGLLAAFVFRWPVVVVYLIVNFDEMLKLPAVYRNYKKYRWVKDLTRKEGEV